MNPRLRRVETAALAATISLPVLFIVLLVAIGWPAWWRWVIPEQSPMTWLESVLLVTCALVAGACLGADHLAGGGNRLRWTAIAGGFLALALDERFAIHERVRDGLLAPHGVRLPVFFWTAAGDFLLLLVLVAALALLPWLLAAFRARRPALVVFLTALAVSLVAVAVDSVDFEALSLGLRRLEQFLEELVETAAMVLFLDALLLRLAGYLTAGPAVARAGTRTRGGA